MRIYIIGNDGITLCCEAPATVSEGEIAVASNEELHSAPLSGKRLLALWNALPGVEKRRKVGDREALIDELWAAIEALPEPGPQSDAKRPSKQDEVIAMLRRPEGATVDEVASATGWQRHRRLLRQRRSAAASTASTVWQAYETFILRCFGPPGLWRAVARSRSTRHLEHRAAQSGHHRGRRAYCRISRTVDTGSASGLARIAPHRTASWAQSRSANPSPCSSAARANPWQDKPGAAAPSAEPGPRVRESRWSLRSLRRAEDRHKIGASMAR